MFIFDISQVLLLNFKKRPISMWISAFLFGEVLEGTIKVELEPCHYTAMVGSDHTYKHG